MIRDIQNVDNDIIRVKQSVKNRLWKDADVIEALHNSKLSPDTDGSCSDALDVNIFDYIRIPDTQDEVRNFICFDVEDDRESYTNNLTKIMSMQFFCISHEDDIKTEFGIPREDVLGYLVTDIVGWSDFLGNGTRWKKYYDKTEIIDVKWHARIIKFKTESPNNIRQSGWGNSLEK
jgi:hypothetical protein